jgi:hypothetical protein
MKKFTPIILFAVFSALIFMSCSETEKYTAQQKGVSSDAGRLLDDITPGEEYRLPLKKRIGTHIYPGKDGASLTLLGRVPVVLDKSLSIKDVLDKILFCRNAEGMFFYDRERLILREVSGEYDSEIAIESSIRIFTGLDSSDVYAWKYTDFKAYLDNYKQKFPWKKLRAISR